MGSDYSDLSRFQGTWPMVRIGSLAAVKGGKRLPLGTSLVADRTCHPYIRIVDLKNGRVDQSSLLFVPDDVFPKIARYTISRSDIYVSIVGTIGLVGVVPDELDGANLTENAAKICDISARVDRDYLAIFLQSGWGQHQIRALTVGSTQAKLALFRIEDILVPLPPLSEQRAISRVLGALDHKIELNRRMSQTLESMARALFTSWFVDFDPVRAKIEGRDTSLPEDLDSTFPSALEDSALGAIPAGWRADTLSSFADVNAESWSSATRPRSIEYVDLTNTKAGRIVATATYATSDAPSRAQRVLRPGDTIFGTVRPGNRSYALVAKQGLTGSTGFAVLRPKKVDYRSFVYLCSTSIDAIDELARLADGAAYPAIAPDRVAATPCVRPPASLLSKFECAAGPWLDRLAGTDREAAVLRTLRDELLPKLLAGSRTS
jgi:type I restriction enzyme S subunit